MRAWVEVPRRVSYRCNSKASTIDSRTLHRNISSAQGSIHNLLRKAVKKDNPPSVAVNGFVRSVRRQKRVAFAEIGDGSCLKPLQAVLSPEQADTLSNGAAVRLEGKYALSPEGKEQDAELHVEQVQLLGANDAMAYPIQNKFQTLEFMRTVPHLRLRTARNALLLRLRSRLIAQATHFFEREGYTQTHTPIITSSDCEGAGEVFEVVDKSTQHIHQTPETARERNDFYGSPKYLTVSGQLQLEALAQSVEKVWTLSPTFRAEKSDTARHLSEFYMLEAELCFTDHLEDVMGVVEGLVKALVSGLDGSKIGEELRLSQSQSSAEEGQDSPILGVADRWQGLLRDKWPRLTYHEAITALYEAVANGQVHFQSGVNGASGLQTEHERYLAESVGNGGPVFVTHYPQAIKPFYMAPSQGVSTNTGPAPTVACFDLLLPEVCEVAGGSLREHRLAPLQHTMQHKGLLAKEGGERNKSPGLDWYLDLRRYGGVPHGGFGLGFDRLVGYIAGVRNIRDVVAFPRWYGRCDC